MSVEEAIEFVKEIQRLVGNNKPIGFTKFKEIESNIGKVLSLLHDLERHDNAWIEFRAMEKLYGRESHYFMTENFADIVSLLRYLEKYKAIVEELENILLPEQYKYVESLIQKYFPQPVKKTITIEVEAKDEIAVNWFIGWLHDTVGGSNEFNHNTIKVNIKEDLNAN